MTGKIQLRHALQRVLELAWQLFSQGGLSVQTCHLCYTRTKIVQRFMYSNQSETVGFEPTISAGDRQQTCALDRADPGIGIVWCTTWNLCEGLRNVTRSLSQYRMSKRLKPIFFYSSTKIIQIDKNLTTYFSEVMSACSIRDISNIITQFQKFRFSVKYL